MPLSNAAQNIENLSKTADILNVLCCMIMIAACTIVAVVLNNKSERKGRFAFLIFWGFWWIASLFLFGFFRATKWEVDAYWGLLCIDAIGNFFVLAAAYSLFRDEDFKLADPVFGYLVGGLVLSCLWLFGLGYIVENSAETWRVFVMAPSQVVASVGVLGLGVAACGRFPQLKFTLVGAAVLYALLQVPAYYALVIDPIRHASNVAQTGTIPYASDVTQAGVMMKFLLCGGKALFFLIFLSCLGYSVWDATTNILIVIRIIIFLLTIAFGLGILYLKINEVLTQTV